MPTASHTLTLIIALILKATEDSDVLSSLLGSEMEEELYDPHADMRRNDRGRSQRKLPCMFSFPVVVSVGRFATMKEGKLDKAFGSMSKRIAPDIM